MLGVKGRVQTRVIEADDGSKRKKTEIIAEKVTFLSTARRKEDENKEEK